VKIIRNDKNNPNKSHKEKSGGNTIIINNHINNFNYNVSFKNPYQNNDICLNRKRNRQNSHEKNTLINLFPDIRRECAGSYHNRKKSCDDSDIMDYFDCTFNPPKNDFEDEKDLLFFSQSPDMSKLNKDMIMIGQSLTAKSDFKFDELLMDYKPEYKFDFKTEKKVNFY
jgi:hypothetical protein